MPHAETACRALAVACLLLLAACSEHSQDASESAVDSAGPGGDQTTAATTEAATEAHADHEHDPERAHAIELGVAHAATGIVRSVDRAAATAVVHHDPVLSIGMPEMTMTFRLADPNLADQLQPGQRISFEFIVEDGVVITTLH